MAVFGDVGPIFEDVLINSTVILDLAYSRQYEQSVDDFGLSLSQRAGYDPSGLITFFEALNAELGEAGGAPPEWLSAHPSFEHRAERLRDALR